MVFLVMVYFEKNSGLVIMLFHAVLKRMYCAHNDLTGTRAKEADCVASELGIVILAAKSNEVAQPVLWSMVLGCFSGAKKQTADRKRASLKVV